MISKKTGPLICPKTFLSSEVALYLFEYYLVDVHLKKLNWLHFLIHVGGLLVILIDCMNFLSPSLDVSRKSLSTVSFFALLNSGILSAYRMLSFGL